MQRWKIQKRGKTQPVKTNLYGIINIVFSCCLTQNFNNTTLFQFCIKSTKQYISNENFPFAWTAEMQIHRKVYSTVLCTILHVLRKLQVWKSAIRRQFSAFLIKLRQSKARSFLCSRGCECIDALFVIRNLCLFTFFLCFRLHMTGCLLSDKCEILVQSVLMQCAIFTLLAFDEKN